MIKVSDTCKRVAKKRVLATLFFYAVADKWLML